MRGEGRVIKWWMEYGPEACVAREAHIDAHDAHDETTLGSCGETKGFAKSPFLLKDVWLAGLDILSSQK